VEKQKNATESQAMWLIFFEEKLLLARDRKGANILPSWDDIVPLGLDLFGKKDMRLSDEETCWTVELLQMPVLPGTLRFVSLFSLFFSGYHRLFKLAGRAVQILAWDRTHRYCGQCGTQTEEKPTEFAKKCPKCGLVGYPRISPSVIVAVTKGRELLLVRSKHFQTYTFHTVISGFVDPGETLEECLHREVKEETGITVKNVRYFGSQPWPFPNSLMLAFTAEYDQGEIVIDDEELYEAGWFSVDNMPFLPHSDSIARQLINWFVDNYS